MAAITEIIPDDMPQWMKDAMDEGQLFKRVCERMKEMEATKKRFFHAGFHLGYGSTKSDYVSGADKIDSLYAKTVILLDKQGE